MSFFQIIATLFGLFMLYVLNIHRRKVKLSLVETSFWISLWIIFIIIAIFPNLLLGLAQTLHFSRVFDFLVVSALMILTIIVITSFYIQRENKQKLEDVVRRVALDRKK